jgi:two-component system, OmpR family, response regulator
MNSDTVLIIDDESDSCLLWKSFLSQLQYNVYTALTLKQGMDMLDRVQPHFIFLDNNLPDGLGWDQVDAIRKKFPDCKINLVSAYAFDPAKWADKNVTVLSKPLSLTRIKALLA